MQKTNINYQDCLNFPVPLSFIKEGKLEDAKKLKKQGIQAKITAIAGTLIKTMKTFKEELSNVTLELERANNKKNNFDSLNNQLISLKNEYEKISKEPLSEDFDNLVSQEQRVVNLNSKISILLERMKLALS